MTRSKGFMCIWGVRPGRLRSWWLLVAAAGLAASLLPVPAAGAAEEPTEAQQVSSPGGVEVVRYAGSDPYELSLTVAQALVDADGGSSEWVVLASGESWADAAVASPLAASFGAPVVLVPPGGLQTATARPDLVEFLRSTGVRRVVIVGGADVLPNHEASVLFGLGMLPRNIERIHSDDPVGTSIAIAERMGMPAEFADFGRTVIIASDQSVADAVAVGPLAAAGPFPLLFTASDALDPRLATYLADQEIEHAVLVGGTAAIAPAVQTVIETAGTTVTRLAGRDRSDTARLAADLFQQHTADDPDCAVGPIRLGLAPAQHPEQALTAGPLLAAQCTPLHYAKPDKLPDDLRNALYFAQNSSRAALIQIFGDEASIADAVVEIAAPPIRLAVFDRLRSGVTTSHEAGVLIIDENGERGRFALAPGRDASAADSGFSENQLAWSPDGTRLAIVGVRHLFVLDIGAGEIREVTVPDLAFRYLPTWLSPKWSPDSTKLAFTAFVDDPSTCMGGDCGDDPFSNHAAEMFLYDTATGTTSRLTYNEVNDAVRSWSPDGTRIALTRSRVPMGIFAAYLHPESLHIMDITTGAVTDVYEPAQSVGGIWWAPDGGHLAFGGAIEDAFAAPRIFLAASDGSAIKQLTPSPGPQATSFGWAIGWSPDSRFVAHGTRYYGAGASTETLHIHDVASGEDASINLDFDARLIARGWSSDGTKLLHMQYPPRPRDQRPLALLGIDPFNGNVEQLVAVPAEITRTSASAIAPDASQMAFIYGDLQFALIGRRWAGLRSQTEIPFPLFVDEFALCDLAWTVNGIRGSCAGYYDF
ncbi:MAG: cell wall-binding repeat-containing protein [Chloroflexi bacterium]|nr:cell wall-binding repeat-containing protein [Chloroflexota bacterium]